MRKTIKEILESRLGVDKSAMKASSDLRNDLGADSLDFIEIIMDCEQEYDMVIYDTEASDIRTIEDLEKLVNESKSPKQALVERYIILDESKSAHCCFTHTVMDSTQPYMIGGKHYEENGKKHYKTVCECFDKESAELICKALNKLEETDGIE